MIRLAEKHRVILTVGHIERFNPAINELKRRLDAGELGRIFEIHARRLGPFPPRIQDVGVIVDLATHDLDIIQTLVEAPAQRVYAETDRRIHVAHEDMVMGLIKFSNGVMATINVNWLTPTKIRELIVIGERGMFVASYLTQELRYYQNLYYRELNSNGTVLGVSEGDVINYRIERCEPLKEELRCFIHSVKTGQPPRVLATDAITALTMAHKLMESSRKQQLIWLSPNDQEALEVNRDGLSAEVHHSADRIPGQIAAPAADHRGKGRPVIAPPIPPNAGLVLG
jgi:predicted dehydrogenase